MSKPKQGKTSKPRPASFLANIPLFAGQDPSLRFRGAAGLRTGMAAESAGVTRAKLVPLRREMSQVTCPFKSVGCGLSLPCVKCRAASSHRSDRLTRPRFHAKPGSARGSR